MQKTDSIGRLNQGWDHINKNLIPNQLYKRQVMIRMSLDDFDWIKAEADRKHTTISELIRTYIVWGMEIENRLEKVL